MPERNVISNSISFEDKRSESNTKNIPYAFCSLRPFPLRLILLGSMTLLFFLCCLAAWASFAPIESAVVSPGIVGVSSHRKLIQHLEGGIVEKIYVHDGDRVQKGQLLVQLRDVQQVSELKQLERQLLEALAVKARLLAEANSDKEIKFPEVLTKRADEISVLSIINSQNNVLTSIRALNSDKRSVFQNKITQAEEEIKGIIDLLNAKKRQHSYIEQDLASTQDAIDKKLIAKNKAFSLRERIAEIEGEIASFTSKISKLEQSILELRLQISEAHAQYLADVTERIREQRAFIFDLSQKIISTQDVLQRTKIVSPIDGIVVNLQVHTQDGVVAAGKPILEIVPTNDDLVIHAFVKPEDIDEVHTGMSAYVQLTSLNRRHRLPLFGVVADISADRLSDDDTGQDYYRARIVLNPDTTTSAKTTLIPGMGTEVFIRTGARTPIEYLLSPIMSSFQLGMREQ